MTSTPGITRPLTDRERLERALTILSDEREHAALAYGLASHLGRTVMHRQQEAERAWRRASQEMADLLIETGAIDLDELKAVDAKGAAEAMARKG